MEEPQKKWIADLLNRWVSALLVLVLLAYIFEEELLLQLTRPLYWFFAGVAVSVAAFGGAVLLHNLADKQPARRDDT